jgi:hypothetical protein
LYQHDTEAPADLGRSAVQSSDGAVLFTDNVCRVTASDASPRGTVSVLVSSLDQLLFANNQCRVDSPKFSLVLDALLVASTVQVDSNRFQEAIRSVFLSGFSTGLMNITSANISTYCLLATAAIPGGLARVNNLALIGSDICDKFTQTFQGATLTASGVNQ